MRGSRRNGLKGCPAGGRGRAFHQADGGSLFIDTGGGTGTGTACKQHDQYEYQDAAFTHD